MSRDFALDFGRCSLCDHQGLQEEAWRASLVYFHAQVERYDSWQAVRKDSPEVSARLSQHLPLVSP